jgi:hypothetical protein
MLCGRQAPSKPLVVGTRRPARVVAARVASTDAAIGQVELGKTGES